MDETGMGMRLEDKGRRMGRGEWQRAGLKIQLGSRTGLGMATAREREGCATRKIGDWGFEQREAEAEFEGEEGQSGKCKSAREGGGPTTRARQDRAETREGGREWERASEKGG